jgi:SPP1 family predicted phage head-tail adaptor
MAITAGQLNRRVTFKLPARTEDAFGFAETFASLPTVATMWAQVEPLRGAELVAAQQQQRESRWKIVTRWRSDLTADMVAVYLDGTVPHYLQIVAVLPQRAAGMVTLECSEVKPAGLTIT